MTPGRDLPEAPGIVPEDPAEWTLAEVSRACAVEIDFVVELVREGVVEPDGAEPGRWRFTQTHLRRVRVASHLHRDLGVNLAGAALALELLEEIEALRARLRAAGGD